MNKRTRNQVQSRTRKLGLYCIKPWCEDDDLFLKDNHDKLNIKQLAESLDRAEASILNHLISLGLRTKNKHDVWTEEENNILRQYFPTEGKNIQKRLPNRNKEAIGVQARKLGLYLNDDLKPKSRLWSKDEDEIIKKYFPYEGTDVVNRLNNCKRWEAQARARFLNVTACYINGPKKVICIETNTIYESIVIASKTVNSGAVGSVCQSGKGTAGGYHWCYVDNEEYLNKWKHLLGTNIKHKKEGGSNHKAIRNIETGEIFNSCKEAADFYNVNPVGLNMYIKGKIKSTGNLRYHFEYIKK